MYTQLFTNAWQLDRCLDIAWITGYVFINPYFLGIVLTLFFFFVLSYFDSFFKKRTATLHKKAKLISLSLFHISKLIVSIIIGVVLIVPMIAMIAIISFIMGIIIFNCSMGPLWERIEPAHKIHAKLKVIRENGGETPRSLEEFKQIDPTAYQQIEGKAKIEYEYIPERDGYHFTIRPSKYYLADFSDEHDYVFYESKSMFSEPKSSY